MKLEREDRQIEALAWCQRMRGSDAVRVIARAHAVAAEAIALAQAEGLGRAELHVLIERTDPLGQACDRVGRLSVAMLAFCEARGLSADHCERNELARLLSLPVANSGPPSDKEEATQRRAASSSA